MDKTFLIVSFKWGQFEKKITYWITSPTVYGYVKVSMSFNAQNNFDCKL